MERDQEFELGKWRNEDLISTSFYEGAWKSSSYPIIIGGCPRSGSTILRFILGSHPRICHGPESHLFLPRPIDTLNLSERFRLPPKAIESDKTNSCCQAEFIDKFQDRLLSSHQGARWLDKTSRNVHVFSWIEKRFPNAWMIHIVRDPRDVVASLRTHPKFKRAQAKRIPTGWLHPWKDCVDRWGRCVGDVVSLRDHPRLIEIRYEDLVTDPQKHSESILSEIGIDPGYIDLSVQSRSSQAKRENKFIINNLEISANIATDRIGRWKNDLPPEVAERLLVRYKSEMQYYGYV